MAIIDRGFNGRLILEFEIEEGEVQLAELDTLFPLVDIESKWKIIKIVGEIHKDNKHPTQ